jgi:Nif-specific regulatory protein
MKNPISREKLMKQEDLETRFSGLAVKFWFDLEDHKITYILPFDKLGGGISEKIRFAARINRPVLIHGPTGTGKELAVQAIHRLSERRHIPLKSINCANLSGELLESELFGHRKGAFTGAITDKKGILELAKDGYIHLDEMGETSHSFQAKLLRLFESNVYYKLGENEEKITNSRFILTTNRPLQRIRSDLFHRFEQKIYLPALSEYESKSVYVIYLIQLLGHKFFRNEFGEKLNYRISLGAVAEAMFYNWPGH